MLLLFFQEVVSLDIDIPIVVVFNLKTFAKESVCLLKERMALLVSASVKI